MGWVFAADNSPLSGVVVLNCRLCRASHWSGALLAPVGNSSPRIAFSQRHMEDPLKFYNREELLGTRQLLSCTSFLQQPIHEIERVPAHGLCKDHKGS